MLCFQESLFETLTMTTKEVWLANAKSRTHPIKSSGFNIVFKVPGPDYREFARPRRQIPQLGASRLLLAMMAAQPFRCMSTPYPMIMPPLVTSPARCTKSAASTQIRPERDIMSYQKRKARQKSVVPDLRAAVIRTHHSRLAAH